MKHLSILFVCLGNTCRSPMAESIMKDLCEEYDLRWYVDSAGLRSWNVGRRPDERCVKILEEYGLKTKHYGRLVCLEDFLKFDYIIAMDEGNLVELETMAKSVGGRSKAKIQLLGTYLGDEYEEIIKDPFFSKGMRGFRCAYNQIYRSCEKFIKQQLKDGKSGSDKPLVQSF